MSFSTQDDPVVYVIDDDLAVLESEVALLEASGIRTRPFASAEAFLSEPIPKVRGCIITDLKLGGMSGQQLQRQLREAKCNLPLIVVTGHATVEVAVTVMETGAVTLLQKPFKPQQLIDAVHRALSRWETGQPGSVTSRHTELMPFKQRLTLLTREEREVMQMMVAGITNKQISARMNCSMRTVDRRRSSVMTKLGVSSVAEVARLAGLLEVEASESAQ